MNIICMELLPPLQQLYMIVGDMGGYMGLLIGASVITLVELLDLIIFNGLCQLGGGSSQRSSVKPS